MQKEFTNDRTLKESVWEAGGGVCWMRGHRLGFEDSRAGGGVPTVGLVKSQALVCPVRA